MIFVKVWLAAISHLIATQDTGAPGKAIKVAARFVQLAVSVNNQTLSKQDFQVFDNGRARSISSFVHGEDRPPLKLLFLIETSGAQIRAVNGLVDSLPQALKILRSTDQVGIASVFPGSKVELEPTSDRSAIPRALEEIRAAQDRYVDNGENKSGHPDVNFDDLTRALRELSRKEADPNGRDQLIIVIVTDDFDLLTPSLAVEASRDILRDGTVVSAFVDLQNPGIAIAGKIVHGMRTVTPMRLGVLDHGASYFAGQTGGPVIKVEKSGYFAALSRLLRDISDNYFIGFTPPVSELDGSYHKLSVTLTRARLEQDETTLQTRFLGGMKALIIDDERLARVELRRLLAEHPEIEIVGEAANIEEAKTATAELHPDLLLLDIQMPGGTGFDLLDQLEFTPRVIFTTGYDEFALQAFEVNALDYLLKPITTERLASALEKALATAAAPSPKLTVHQQIFIKEGERCWFVKVQEIALLESEGNYTRVYFGSNRPLISRSLRTLEERLDPAIFFRTSRKHLVNLQAIEGVEPSISGGFELRIRSGLRVEMSRRRTIDFRIQMSL